MVPHQPMMQKETGYQPQAMKRRSGACSLPDMNFRSFCKPTKKFTAQAGFSSSQPASTVLHLEIMVATSWLIPIQEEAVEILFEEERQPSQERLEKSLGWEKEKKMKEHQGEKRSSNSLHGSSSKKEMVIASRGSVCFRHPAGGKAKCNAPKHGLKVIL
ncbi:unnamed protein product [Cuscuta campestris]|uniref:Uncharacterized protein n=1 Tax=Cuscuta campestris TaxID=132261 RepID=A0A484MMP3_9ASTE|nr:unnamed protein product [Cuscuta campestris]